MVYVFKGSFLLISNLWLARPRTDTQIEVFRLLIQSVFLPLSYSPDPEILDSIFYSVPCIIFYGFVTKS